MVMWRLIRDDDDDVWMVLKKIKSFHVLLGKRCVCVGTGEMVGTENGGKLTGRHEEQQKWCDTSAVSSSKEFPVYLVY